MEDSNISGQGKKGGKQEKKVGNTKPGTVREPI